MARVLDLWPSVGLVDMPVARCWTCGHHSGHVLDLQTCQWPGVGLADMTAARCWTCRHDSGPSVGHIGHLICGDGTSS